MDTSLLIARFLGPVLLAAAILLVARPRVALEMAQDFLQSPALIFLSGVLAMVAGLAIVTTHAVWTGWPILITLFGWALTLGGAVRMIAPDIVTRIGAAMLKGTLRTRIAGAVWAAVALWLCHAGYLQGG